MANLPDVKYLSARRPQRLHAACRRCATESAVLPPRYRIRSAAAESELELHPVFYVLSQPVCFRKYSLINVFQKTCFCAFQGLLVT